jgi:rRNA maturation endonuclease Nob1
MIEVEQEPHICLECDAEFVVHAVYGEEDVAFCPFCGSDIDQEDLDEEDLDDEDSDEFQ